MPYYEDLTRARADAAAEFFAQSQLYKEIVASVRGLLPELVLQIQKTCSIDRYTLSLLASFVRSSFVSLELIVNSELVEAVAINRKQMELLARLGELDQAIQANLTGKTPNLKHLVTGTKRLYGPYSEAAHSSTYASQSLLGVVEGRTRRNHLLYPEFTENTEMIFQNWLSIYFEFTLWVIDFKTAHIAAYEPNEDSLRFQSIFDLYKKSGLKDKYRMP